jgi:hypothetical protein
LESGAGLIARGRTAQWRSCLQLVGPHKDVWDMGTLAADHPSSPLPVQFGLQWKIRPEIVQE